MPPTLKWELPLWNLFTLLQRQVRVGAQGPYAFDMNVFIPRIENKGWNIDVSLELLSTIENEILRADDTDE